MPPAGVYASFQSAKTLKPPVTKNRPDLDGGPVRVAAVPDTVTCKTVLNKTEYFDLSCVIEMSWSVWQVPTHVEVY